MGRSGVKVERKRRGFFRNLTFVTVKKGLQKNTRGLNCPLQKQLHTYKVQDLCFCNSSDKTKQLKCHHLVHRNKEIIHLIFGLDCASYHQPKRKLIVCVKATKSQQEGILALSPACFLK